MAISEQQALDLLYYGKTRDDQIVTNTGNWDLSVALGLAFEFLAKGTVMNAEQVHNVFKERLVAIANLQLENS